MPGAEAQFLKKLGKRAERAAERTVERRVERETSEKTDQVLDSILEPGSGNSGQGNPASQGSGGSDDAPQGNSGNMGNSGPGASQGGAAGPPSLQVYSKFDFVPGDKVIFYDDFSNDFIGDFPSKWNTNGSGEVVTVGDSGEKWFELKPGYNTYYIPLTPSLPDEYTIEFDVLATGLDRQTASTAILKVWLSDDPGFRNGNYAEVDIPFCQYHPVGFHARNGGDINNNISGDIRNKVLGQPHISIAVNRQRYRLWVDESKYVDIPRMISASNPPSTLKFEVRNFKDGKERLFIRNLKVAEGGLDLRRQLISEGSVSTNAILFDSGSANLQPSSMGVIRQISQVLQQETGMNLQIVGHTDSDGDTAANQRLSEARAAAVKDALVSVYGIDAGRLTTAGKGESEPVADNGTPDGKAQNRRVVFNRQ